MEHLVEVSYRRDRLMLVDFDHGQRSVRGVVLDVWLDHWYRGGLRGFVSETDLLGQREDEIADREFVARVARCAGEGFRSAVLNDPAVLDAGKRPTIPCGPYMDRSFESNVLPHPGAVVMRFTTNVSGSLLAGNDTVGTWAG